MILRAKQLSAAYGARFVFKDLSLSAAVGETLFISGANGSGKTTLLQILAGLKRPLTGTISVDETIVSPSSPKVSAGFRERVGFLGHELFLYREMTVRENLDLFAKGHGLKRFEESDAAKSAIESFKLSPFLGTRLDACSFGVAKKTSIVRALLHGPELLIFDEPFSGLDKQSCEHLRAMLLARKNAGVAIILSSHDEAFAEGLITKRLELNG